MTLEGSSIGLLEKNPKLDSIACEVGLSDIQLKEQSADVIV